MRKYNECPKCGGKGHWRRGVHFDHEMKCETCCFNFDPDELLREEQTEREAFVTDRD